MPVRQRRRDCQMPAAIGSKHTTIPPSDTPTNGEMVVILSSAIVMSDRTLGDAGSRIAVASSATLESVGVVAANDRTGITTVTAGSTNQAIGMRTRAPYIATNITW